MKHLHFLKLWLPAFLLLAASLGLTECGGNGPTVNTNPGVAVDTAAAQADAGHWYCTARMPEGERGVAAPSKFWVTGSTLRIGFIGGTAAQVNRWKTVTAPAWSSVANINFAYPATGPYDQVWYFATGSNQAWSYIGTDCRAVLAGSPNAYTGVLGWDADDAWWHELGHALGLLHEQQHFAGICFDTAAVIASLSGPPNNWSVAQIYFNVLTKHVPAQVLATAYDANSIMHYYISAAWTCPPKKAIPGGKVLSPGDKAIIADIYKGRGTVTPAVGGVTLTDAKVAEIWAAQQAAKTARDAAKVAFDAAYLKQEDAYQKIKTALGK